jgi:hypothetical protein
MLPQKTNRLRSPKNAKAIFCFQAIYEQKPTINKIKRLFFIIFYFFTRVFVLEHENKSLYNTLDLQKKKGRTGVRLNFSN